MPVTMCLLNHDAQFTSGKIRLHRQHCVKLDDL